MLSCPHSREHAYLSSGPPSSTEGVFLGISGARGDWKCHDPCLWIGSPPWRNDLQLPRSQEALSVLLLGVLSVVNPGGLLSHPDPLHRRTGAARCLWQHLSSMGQLTDYFHSTGIWTGPWNP